MFWTPELAYFLEDAPWPASKEDLIDFANRTGAPQQVIDNLLELEELDVEYEGIEDIWPEYENATEDYFYDEDDEENNQY